MSMPICMKNKVEEAVKYFYGKAVYEEADSRSD